MAPLDSRPSLGAGIRWFRSEADTVYGAEGILANRTSRSTVGDLFATVNLGAVSRIELQGSAQLDEKVAGAGLRLFAGPPERQGRLVLAYRLPDLATPEQSTFGGHISRAGIRSEEHTSELQSLMRISYAVFCLKKKTRKQSK